MKEFLPVFDRETALTFVSMVIAAYAWITMEKVILAIVIGVAMRAIQVVVYEILAENFSWHHLQITDTFRSHILSHLHRIISRTQRV